MLFSDIFIITTTHLTYSIAFIDIDQGKICVI